MAGNIGKTDDFTWREKHCKKCDICQKMCPRQGLKLVDGILTRDQTKCNLCGICALYCPDQAIEIKKANKQQSSFGLADSASG